MSGDEGKLAAVRMVLDTWDPESWTRGEARQDPGLQLFGDEASYEDTVFPDLVGEVYRGFEGLVRAADRWGESYGTLNLEVKEIRVVGDRVVSFHDVKARARHSGIEFDGQIAYVWTLRDEHPVHVKSFVDLDLALEDAARPT